ncbi:uncharacterized protein FOMMEDRAFT_158400 [Fomitiporia mediterranea MF3/22]|uniref:uncharacterized protein n=1 Tax=Fomitiporia mediterranea (strain MF3/22) TaxID=694068 RepID=UPI000440924B|nr:uncharacterized protein FOMMEDRAFT_158400 [Fomitiporia mediterranea MF3/22]EJD01269.1 hypothetical protein FOMMEDRAFT_158400 [Fomitiporia mediterranea MF3/22]
MHKNPFVPSPSYPTVQQPPLPPGPPPPQPAAQPDYSAYWAAQQQPAAQPAFNPQWAGTNPQWPAAQSTQVSVQAKPSTDQSAALYANYGYGGHQAAHWQQHQHAHQQQHHYAQPPAAVAPSVAPQPYNPYQPQNAATYAQPAQPYSIPQALPPPQTPAQQQYRPPQAPQQPYFQQQQQQQPRGPASTLQRTAPQQQQMPPAKRPRFDNTHQSPPQQPRFQQAVQPMSMQGVPVGPSKQSGMSGLPSQPSQMQSQGKFSGGMGRGGMGGRGPNMNRGGRGGNMGSNRGMGMNRGHGGMHGGGRGGGSGHSSNASMRNHQSRDRGGFGNFNRRGGSSFNNGPQHHQGGSARSGHGNRSGGSMHGGHGGRSGRSDGFHQHRALSNATNTSGGIGKREENRRTLTDFKIVGLEVRSLDWHWGYIPPQSGSETIKSEENVKAEESEQILEAAAAETQEVSADTDKYAVKETQTAHSASNGATAARMRIYFHTPPSADDARPILPTPSVSDLRKGKRKKVDDDEGDIEDGIRAPPPPPRPRGHESEDSHANETEQTAESGEHDKNIERESVAPSVAETGSEADWLMAAIVDGDADADGEMDIYEQTQVEADVSVHDDGELHTATGDMARSGRLGEIVQNMLPVDVHTDSHIPFFSSQGHYEANESLVEPKTQEDNTADTQVADNVTGDGNDEAPTQIESPAASMVPPEPTGIQSVKAEEADSSVPREVAHTESSVAEAGQKNDGASDLSQMKEESIELIVSSIIPNDPSENDDGKPQPSDSAVKEDIGTAEKPVTMDAEHLPEPPASPTSNTAFSGTSTGTSTANPDLPAKPAASSTRVASANRVSIAYAAGTRRLIVDADVVEKMTIFRAEGRIDIDMTIERTTGGFKGILIETLNESKAYSAITDLSEALESDSTLPPFWKAESGTKVVINVHLDKDRPLSEPKWIKTGDVQDWLKDMFGGRFWVAGEAVGWEKKIEVRYPDPAPTIQTVLTSWSTNSPVGVASERSRFLKTHMTDADNVLEIFLRLVRGERATPFSQNASSISTPSIQGPLLAALDTSSPHAAQQTHVSLAVMALVRLATQYAEQALGEGKGKEQVDERDASRIQLEHRQPWNTYDSDNTVFSPQGRIHQVEYSLEAVKQGSAVVGLRSKTHAILLALKRSTGELSSYQQKMFRIDDHVGIGIAGLTSDARVLSNFMRQQAMSERMVFNRPIPVNRIVTSIADKAQVNTQEYGRRPYGVGFLIIGQDSSGPHLFEFSPSGLSFEYFAMSIGARSQSAKTYLERHFEEFAECTLEKLIVHGLHALRETLQQDKELTIHNTTIGIIGPAGELETGVPPEGPFRMLEEEKVDPYIQMLPARTPSTRTAVSTTMDTQAAAGSTQPPPGDEDVQMSE